MGAGEDTQRAAVAPGLAVTRGASTPEMAASPQPHPAGPLAVEAEARAPAQPLSGRGSAGVDSGTATTPELQHAWECMPTRVCWRNRPECCATPAGRLAAEEEYGRLPVVHGPPAVGSVVAYRLLEIGPDLAPQARGGLGQGRARRRPACTGAKHGSIRAAPDRSPLRRLAPQFLFSVTLCKPPHPCFAVQVSEARAGRVEACDAASGALTLAPHPDPAIHPLTWWWAAARARRVAEAAAEGDEIGEEEDEEQGGLAWVAMHLRLERGGAACVPAGSSAHHAAMPATPTLHWRVRGLGRADQRNVPAHLGTDFYTSATCAPLPQTRGCTRRTARSAASSPPWWSCACCTRRPRAAHRPRRQRQLRQARSVCQRWRAQQSRRLL